MSVWITRQVIGVAIGARPAHRDPRIAARTLALDTPGGRAEGQLPGPRARGPREAGPLLGRRPGRRARHRLAGREPHRPERSGPSLLAVRVLRRGRRHHRQRRHHGQDRRREAREEHDAGAAQGGRLGDHRGAQRSPGHQRADRTGLGAHEPPPAGRSSGSRACPRLRRRSPAATPATRRPASGQCPARCRATRTRGSTTARCTSGRWRSARR